MSALALTPEAIRAAMGRLGLLAPGQSCQCEPLTGGVSSDIWWVRAGAEQYCVKRALPRLKVAQVWEAPVDRNRFEWKWFETAGAICPGAVPPLVARDAQAHLFVMRYLDPEQYPLWKNQLRDGVVDKQTARAVAQRLVQIHAETAGRSEVAREFATDESFHAIRLEPYLVATGRAHPDLAAQFAALVQATATTKYALVHGDMSPKNILVGPKGPVFLDAECAWYGDPAFDLAFCLNHLLLKCVWRPPHTRDYLDSFTTLAKNYLAGVPWEPASAIEARVAKLLPGLLLARIDGKSPVEYITQDADKARVRAVARSLIIHPVETLAGVRAAWEANS